MHSLFLKFNMNKFSFILLKQRKLFRNVSNLIFRCNLYGTTNVTLDQRLLKYIATKQPSAALNLPSVENLPQKITNLAFLENRELISLTYSLTRKSYQKIIHDLDKLDKEYCRRLPRFNQEELFLFMNICAISVPYYIQNLQFFSQALHFVSFFLDRLSVSELIQLCFYAGLKKKSVRSQKIIRYCLNKLNDINLLALITEDIIIICNSAFRTSTRITQQNILKDIQRRLYNQLSILNDESFYVTIVKSLRHNYNYDEELLLTLSNAMFFNKTLQNYNFTSLAHILTLYADALYFDHNLIERINQLCLDKLKNASISSKRMHYSLQIRLKDMSKYLWSLSYLGCENLQESDIDNVIMPILNKFISLGNVEDDIYEYVGTLLSLWSLRYFPINVLPEILVENKLAKG